MNPDYKEAMVTIARDHYRARKMELAKYALTAILDGFGEGTPPRDKENAEAHLIRGLILREAGRRAAALADYEACYAKRPDLVEWRDSARGHQARGRKRRGGAPGPLEGRETRAEERPCAPQPGRCLPFGKGRPADGKRELEQALALDSTLAIAHYNLGLLYLVAASVPGMSAADQAGQSIKEFETYKTMRGVKAEKGDDVGQSRTATREQPRLSDERKAVPERPEKKKQD